jgi:hypothetical protein
MHLGKGRRQSARLLHEAADRDIIRLGRIPPAETTSHGSAMVWRLLAWIIEGSEGGLMSRVRFQVGISSRPGIVNRQPGIRGPLGIDEADALPLHIAISGDGLAEDSLALMTDTIQWGFSLPPGRPGFI